MEVHKTKVIISLTSYPARINIVDQVIESLFKQKEQADEIILWLSKLEFPEKYENLPEKLIRLIGKNGFRIEWVNENIKSHKKYFYALQDRKNIIITVDDDIYYSEWMIGTLMDSYRKHPHAISARKIHVITKNKEKICPYLTWGSAVTEYIGLEKMDLCAVGVNGILYPPGVAKKRWFNLSLIMENAENQDDLWLKFNEVIDGIPVVYTGLKEDDRIIEGSQNSALYHKNLIGGDNDLSIEKLSDVFSKNYKLEYQQWFECLMQIEEFWHEKRRYYCSQLNNIISQWPERDIYICGAGKYAHILYKFIKSCEKEKNIFSFLVTKDVQKGLEDKEIGIKVIEDLMVSEKFAVICGVGERYKKEFEEALTPYKMHEWADMDLLGIEKLLQWENMESTPEL